MSDNLNFGFVVATVGGDDLDDAALYQEVIADCRLGQSLGYDSAWMLEHHFSDYFPTPSPLVFMSHVAAYCPGLSLGSSVLVAPWYQPLRLLGEISMLSNLVDGDLFIGVGRGTAKMEYDAFDVNMEDARGRLRECLEIIDLGLSGEPFTYDGEHFKIGRTIQIRPVPQPDRVHLFGAIGSPESARLTGEMKVAPLNICQFPFHILEKMYASWNEGAANVGFADGGRRPVVAHCLMADTDEEALAMARTHLSRFFRLQSVHYEADSEPWTDIKGYEQFNRYFGNLLALSQPENIDKFSAHNFVGSAKTVAGQVERLHDIGFNHIIVHPATVGVPREIRHDTLRRFATSVAPGFSGAFA
ncbi:MAG: LLM class flavin-dependent oxidoreductase [Alphaproteobacteria bacterium]|nr:LLM class flavin-dependent oxidoreductase [Alphaproteobacteria bacterium]